MAKSSSEAGSKKLAKPAKPAKRLSAYAGAMLCKGTRDKPIGDDYACRQVLGIIGKNGVSIKCRRCKGIMEFTWQDLKILREKLK